MGHEGGGALKLVEFEHALVFGFLEKLVNVKSCEVPKVEGGEQVGNQAAIRGFVESHTQRPVFLLSEVDSTFASRIGYLSCRMGSSLAQPDTQGVKHRACTQGVMSKTRKSTDEGTGESLRPSGDPL